MMSEILSGFLFISKYISLDLLSLGGAEADSGWGGKLNGHFMASCVWNIHTQKYENLMTGFQVTIENLMLFLVFFGTQCSWLKVMAVNW